MKKSAIILSVLSVIFFSSFAYAEHEHSAEEGAAPQEEQPSDMKDKMKKMHGKGGMMHQQPTVVATSDGGIVVLQGPKLAKYDAQLNLINEVELKGGPKPGEKKPEAAPEEASSGPTPMSEKEIAAALGQ